MKARGLGRQLLRLPGGTSQATTADAIADMVGEAHAERAESGSRW